MDPKTGSLITKQDSDKTTKQSKQVNPMSCPHIASASSSNTCVTKGIRGLPNEQRKLWASAAVTGQSIKASHVISVTRFALIKSCAQYWVGNVDCLHLYFNFRYFFHFTAGAYLGYVSMINPKLRWISFHSAPVIQSRIEFINLIKFSLNSSIYQMLFPPTDVNHGFLWSNIL